MRKFGLVAALFACIFGFCGCEEEKENKPATEKEISYVLENVFSPETLECNTDITKIVVFEFDKYGNVVDRKNVATLRYNEDVELYAQNLSVTRIEVYSYWSATNEYYVQMQSIYVDLSNEVGVTCGATIITEQEYLQGVNR